MSTEYFNNDKLGRVLEQLYRRGLNHIFMSVVLEAVKIYELETSTVHFMFMEIITQDNLLNFVRNINIKISNPTSLCKQ